MLFRSVPIIIFLYQVNGIKLSGKSQSEAVNVLRSTRGLVKLLVQREETVLQGTKPAIEVGILIIFRAEGSQMYNIFSSFMRAHAQAMNEYRGGEMLTEVVVD